MSTPVRQAAEKPDEGPHAPDPRDVPETPPDEPKPQPVQDPPAEPDTVPYVVSWVDSTDRHGVKS